MFWIAAGCVALLMLLGCWALSLERKIEQHNRRLDDLEQARPVKIEDGPVRLSRYRQDR